MWRHRRPKSPRARAAKKPAILAPDRLEIVYSKSCTMSVEQILEELSKLTPEERREIFEQLAELESQHTARKTMLMS
jgi:hypothetical protein